MGANKRIAGLSGTDSAFLEALVNSIPAAEGKAVPRAIDPDRLEDILEGRALDASVRYVRSSARRSADIVEGFIKGNCPYFTIESDPGARYYVTHNITIGRLPHNDLQLTSSSVSRLHCRIFIEKGVYYCVDMTPEDRDNKAILDGNQVRNGHPANADELYAHALSDGSELIIGSETLVFHCRRPADSSYERVITDCHASMTIV